jgi:site-specific recombinase XerD
MPTYLSAAQVQKVLEGCDRATALGRRDYAILVMLGTGEQVPAFLEQRECAPTLRRTVG